MVALILLRMPYLGIFHILPWPWPWLQTVSGRLDGLGMVERQMGGSHMTLRKENPKSSKIMIRKNFCCLTVSATILLLAFCVIKAKGELANGTEEAHTNGRMTGLKSGTDTT